MQSPALCNFVLLRGGRDVHRGYVCIDDNEKTKKALRAGRRASVIQYTRGNCELAKQPDTQN